MSSFLAELGETLRTDVADTLRASIDPVFAQQQTEARFRREERQEIREADLREVNRRAQIQEAADALQRKSAVQYKLVEDALENGRETGDFTALFQLSQAPGLLDEVRGHATTAYEARFGRSWGSLVKEQELMNATRRLSAQDTANLLRSEELNSREEIAMYRIAVEQSKQQYDQAQEIARQNRDITNRNALVESIRAEKGVWSESEKAGIISSMNAADSKTALQIYQRAWDNHWKKRDLLTKATNAANRRTANQLASIAAPSGVEVDQAFNFIESVLGRNLTTDELEPEEFQAFAIELATVAKREARNKARANIVTDFGNELPNAMEDVIRGFEGEEDLFNDTASFSLERLMQAREEEDMRGRPPIDDIDDRLIRQAIRAQSLQPGDTMSHTFQDGITRTIRVTPELIQ